MKKKVIIISLATVLFLAVIGLVLFFALRGGDDPTPSDGNVYIYRDFRYVILDDGTVGISGYTGSGGEINVPDAIEGRSVSSVEPGAFSASSVSRVHTGRFLKKICENAFSSCASLEYFSSEGTLSYIGDGAFSGCSLLSSLVLTEDITEIGSYAFSGCTALTALPEAPSLSRLGTGAFSGCTSLVFATLPDSLSAIPDYAFSGCTALAEISLPAVKSLG